MSQGLTEELYNHIDAYREQDDFSPAEKLAIEYAERFALSHQDLDDAFFDRLREHFSDQEIMELTVTLGFCLGIGRALAVLDIANDCEINLTKEPVVYDHA